MDDQQFDALTRRLSRTRRSTLFALGTLGFSVALDHDAGARKKRRRRKKKQEDNVSPPPGPSPTAPPAADPCPGKQLCNGECIPREQCCTKADCPATAEMKCCNGLCSDTLRRAGASCKQHTECCSNYCPPARTVGPFEGVCAETCRGRLCTLETGCCRGFTCVVRDGSTTGTCGGCNDHGTVCETNADCCSGACTQTPGSSQKQCLSFAGGACTRNFGCRSCYVNEECSVEVRTPDGETISSSICHNGVCGCPDECCKSSDCPPGQNCIRDEDGLHGQCKPQVIGP